MGLFGSDDEYRHDRSAGRLRHSDKTSFEVLESVLFVNGLEVTPFGFWKKNDEIVFSQSGNPVLIGGLQEAKPSGVMIHESFKEPKFVKKNPGYSAAALTNPVAENKRIEP